MIKRTTLLNKIIVIVTVLLLLSACGKKAVFEEYRKMENSQWNRFDIQVFEVPVHQGDLLDFYLLMHLNNNYPYDHLDVNITFYLPDGEMRSGDDHFELNDKQNPWKSEGNRERDFEWPVQNMLKIEKDGLCKVRVENKMTKLETPGITEIGLIVKKSKTTL